MWINFALLLKDLLYLGVIVLLSYLFYLERKKLLDRIMAKNYEQFEYYQNMFKEEVDELKNLRKDVRAEKSEDDDIKKELDLQHDEEKKFVEGMEEDWNIDDVDLPKLRTKINKEK